MAAQVAEAEADGMARLPMGFMIILFWTGLINGPAGAAQGLDDPGQILAATAQAEAQAVEQWLLDVAACEAGDTWKCAPVLY